MPDNEIRFIDTSVQLDKDLNILIIEYSFLPCKMLRNKKNQVLKFLTFDLNQRAPPWTDRCLSNFSSWA